VWDPSRLQVYMNGRTPKPTIRRRCAIEGGVQERPPRSSDAGAASASVGAWSTSATVMSQPEGTAARTGRMRPSPVRQVIEATTSWAPNHARDSRVELPSHLALRPSRVFLFMRLSDLDPRAIRRCTRAFTRPPRSRREPPRRDPGRPRPGWRTDPASPARATAGRPAPCPPGPRPRTSTGRVRPSR
jgi:hypothetical protein